MVKEDKRIIDALANLEKLPPFCFGRNAVSNTIIRITAGQMGYSIITNQDWPMRTALEKGLTLDQFIDKLNHYEGVTKAQRQAMEFGSMFGWGIKMADPDIYDEDGYIIKEKLKEQ